MFKNERGEDFSLFLWGDGGWDRRGDAEFDERFYLFSLIKRAKFSRYIINAFSGANVARIILYMCMCIRVCACVYVCVCVGVNRNLL